MLPLSVLGQGTSSKFALVIRETREQARGPDKDHSFMLEVLSIVMDKLRKLLIQYSEYARIEILPLHCVGGWCCTVLRHLCGSTCKGSRHASQELLMLWTCDYLDS